MTKLPGIRNASEEPALLGQRERQAFLHRG